MESLPLSILNEFESLPLSEIKKVELMNRVDRKYLTDYSTFLKLMKMIKDDYFIQESGGKRLFRYFTLYFDTIDKEMFIRHHNGFLVREKIRTRCYSESGVNFFEIKKRDNKGFTRKKRIWIKNGELNSEIVDFLNTNSCLKKDDIAGCIQTKFERITLVNRLRSERVTIDLNLEFENKCTGRNFSLGDLVIIEIKQDSRGNSTMRDCLKDMRIKETGFSKYCIGSILTDNTLKRNLFKTKLMQIDKITKYRNGIIY